jgi:threonine aldolase
MLIDLRSDTVTRPTPEMLKYMFSARVGDDVYKEDPSINELQEKTAKIFGKEAGLFCPSGTMTNQCAIKAHTQPGDEVICDVSAHIFNYEGGGMAFNSGVQAKLVNGDRGRFTAKQVEEVLHPQADWLPRTSLVCIENTSNRGGGSYYRLQDVKEIAEVSHKNNLALHLDGARIFNALTETGESPLEYGKLCDSISVCFSKGLGAPVGSVILGSHEFIGKARRVRKLFGGGMRQGGYLAAAAIYALDNHIGRLKEDHKRAKILGDVLKTNSMVLDMLPVETNIIIFTLSDGITAEKFVQLLGRQNILVSATGKQTVRMVTHLDFTDPMLEIVEKAIKSI